MSMTDHAAGIGTCSSKLHDDPKFSLLGDASAKFPDQTKFQMLDREFPSRSLRKSEES